MSDPADTMAIACLSVGVCARSMAVGMSGAAFMRWFELIARMRIFPARWKSSSGKSGSGATADQNGLSGDHGERRTDGGTEQHQ